MSPVDRQGGEARLPDCEHGYFAAGGTDTCPACDADALDYLERRKAEAEAAGRWPEVGIGK